MVEYVAKISKGSRMDQIYIPKQRHGFPVGSYVVLKPIQHVAEKHEGSRKYFYNVKNLEPLKVYALEKIFTIIDCGSDTCKNIIITGSFLEKGFQFNDLDILLISEEKEDTTSIKKQIAEELGMNAQILTLTQKELLKGVSTDPLYKMMLSRCVAKKRLIEQGKKTKNYKLLDLHLLKSKTMIDNFDLLDGNEKWYLTRNMIAILLFLENKKVNPKNVEEEVRKALGVTNDNIKKNMIEKKEFLRKYKFTYQKTVNIILEGIEHSTQNSRECNR